MIIHLETAPAENKRPCCVILSPLSKNLEASHRYIRGYPDEIRVMIWTWKVVAAVTASSNCDAAMRLMTPRACQSVKLFNPAPENASKDDQNIIVSIGAARTKSGKFERVQYFKKPTFLYC